MEPIRLTQPCQMETTIEKRLAWMHRQVAPSLAAVIKAFDGEMTEIYELIRDGMKRLKPRDLVMIQRFKETTKYEKGQPTKPLAWSAVRS